MSVFEHLTAFIHPIMVHFPIALLITTALIEFAFIIFKKQVLHTVSFYTLFLGVIFAYIAISTGPEDVHLTIYEYHTTAAWTSTILFTIALIMRVGKMRDISFFRYANLRYLYGLLMILGFVGILITGYFGGAMVYEHGVGVVTHQTNNAGTQGNQ